MSAPQPYPLADFVDGLDLSREPFLSIQNAYRELRNGRTYRGRLEKRTGYASFGVLSDNVGVTGRAGVSNNGEEVTWLPFAPTKVGYFGTMIPETAVFTYTDGDAPPNVLTATFKQPIGYGLGAPYPIVDPTGVEIGEYRITNPITLSGQVTIDWKLHASYQVPSGDLGTLDYATYVGEGSSQAVVALPRFKSISTEDLLAIDEENLYRFDGTYFPRETEANGGVAAGLEPPFTHGDNADVWTWPTDSYLLIVNGRDPIYRWNPDDVSGRLSLQPVALEDDAGTPTGDEIQAAALAVVFRNRLVYFNTLEGPSGGGGTRYPHRARWSEAAAYTTLRELDWADAPVDAGEIRTLGFVGERLFVGFEERWFELVPTGNATQAFRWRPIVSEFGSAATRTTITDSARLLTRSDRGVEAVDPNGQYSVDTAIPDLVLNLDPGRASISHAIRNDRQRAFWWAYVDQNNAEDTPQQILVAQYDQKDRLSWTIYDVPVVSLGTYEQASSLVWDDLPGVPDDYENIAPDDYQTSDRFPIVVGGDTMSRVIVFDQTSSDLDQPIFFEAQTVALNPFSSQGQEANLAWVDIYASSSGTTQVALSFYDRVGGSAYKQQTIDLTPDETGKVYRRVKVNRKAFLHQIKLETSDPGIFKLDALVPWFRPAGRVGRF